MPRVTKAQKKVHIVSFSNDIVKMIADRFDLNNTEREQYLFEENGLTVSDEMIKSMNIDFQYDTPRNFLTKLGYNIIKVNYFNCLAVYPDIST